jgi:CDP-diacylglycerol---glycerol-3-phosphate 3-phosphatidyltransferase
LTIRTIYDLKPAFQNLLRPMTRGLFRMGVSANMVTIAALLLSIGIGTTIYIYRDDRHTLLLLPPVLLLRMALNAIDGMLAREHGQKSRVGAFLNELGDVLSDIALYLPLAATPWFAPPLVVMVVLLAVISEMAGVLAQTIGTSRRYDGPMGKSDRAFCFGALGLVLGSGVRADHWPNVLLGLMLLLLSWTILNRSRRALAEA